MNSIAFVKSLIADGVSFSTDGKSIRWENGGDKVDAAVIDELRKGKAEIIAFLRGDQSREQAARLIRAEMANRQLQPDMTARDDDAERYADALRLYGPMSYGMAMRVLGWGGTRAGQAEDVLRLAGRITFNKQGRAVLMESENHQNEVER